MLKAAVGKLSYGWMALGRPDYGPPGLQTTWCGKGSYYERLSVSPDRYGSTSMRSYASLVCITDS
eukprot:524856-Pleurochrysis_carterae.AAC.1